MIESVRARGFVCAVVARCGCDSLTLARGLAAQLRLLKAGARIERSGRQMIVVGQHGASVSVSHSGERTAIAIAAHARVGVDLERLRALPVKGLATRYFVTDEAEAITHAADDARLEIFFRLWTLKEAQGKLLGEGLAGGALSWRVPALDDVGHGCGFASIDGRDWCVVRRGEDVLALASDPGLGPRALDDVRTVHVNHACTHRRRVGAKFSQ